MNHPITNQPPSRRALRTAVLAALTAGVGGAASAAQAASLELYRQDFEQPADYVNNAADVNIFTTVNENYGGQPAGFGFAQRWTVETLHATGTDAFGTGYTDPAGAAGNYLLGMLEGIQNDLLSLSFDAGDRDFFNFRLDLTSIDLSSWGGPFVARGVQPVLQVTLYDNPGGGPALTGNGQVLDQRDVTGTASDQTVIDFTRTTLALDASGSTNGGVTVALDLIAGGYAGLDNFLIVASDLPGDLGQPVTPIDPIEPSDPRAPTIPPVDAPVAPPVDAPVAPTPGTPAAVPTPAALPAGLLLLTALVGRHRRRV